MIAVEPEILLSGGNVNIVVSVGDTVHGKTTAASTTVHRLLDHLAAAGFAGLATRA